MKTWLLLLSVGMVVLLAGCSTTPTERDLPEHLFAGMAAESHPPVWPLPLGERPRAMAVHTEGGALLCFDHANARQLVAQREVAETNQRIAGDLAQAVGALQDERQALIAAGHSCELRADLLDAALETERAQHARDNFWNRIGLGALLLALIL